MFAEMVTRLFQMRGARGRVTVDKGSDDEEEDEVDLEDILLSLTVLLGETLRIYSDRR